MTKYDDHGKPIPGTIWDHLVKDSALKPVKENSITEVFDPKTSSMEKELKELLDKVVESKPVSIIILAMTDSGHVQCASVGSTVSLTKLSLIADEAILRMLVQMLAAATKEPKGESNGTTKA